jgi:hypothetical protein
LQEIERFAQDAIESLEIGSSIRSIYVEKTESPWNEKALIKRKGPHLDVKITVWKGNAFLYGRVFRLLLYIYDVVNPDFHYDPKIAPREAEEPMITARYNQIWSLYVDSRMERRGIENFFDKRMRRNLFMDMEKQISWEEVDAIFQSLWAKLSFTYPEIIDYSYNLQTLSGQYAGQASSQPEVEINARIKSPHVKEHLDRIPTAALRNMVNEILSFTAYHCKDCHITSSYFGISFLYQRQPFAELIPTSEDLLYFTYIDPDSETYKTQTITGDSELKAIQSTIRTVYQKLTAHTQNV